MYGLRRNIGIERAGMFEMWKRKRKQVVRCCKMVSCIICETPITIKEPYTVISGKFYHNDCIESVLLNYERENHKGYETA